MLLIVQSESLKRIKTRTKLQPSEDEWLHLISFEILYTASNDVLEKK